MTRPMGQVRQLDQRINDAGYLRLMPVEPLVMNLSNTLRNIPAMVSKTEARMKSSKTNKWFDLPPIKRTLLSLYDWIFRTYYDRG